MANPLQPKCIKILEEEWQAYVINIIGSSKIGHMDIVACVGGLFYGFEIKWKTDTPSESQKKKINDLINSGGRGYFIRSEDQLRDILSNNRNPVKYALKDIVKL